MDDVRSDMSRFHRVDEIEDMEATRFFAFAHRLGHYGGAITSRIAEQATAENAGVAQDPAVVERSLARQVDGTRAALEADPLTAGLFSFSTAPLA